MTEENIIPDDEETSLVEQKGSNDLLPAVVRSEINFLRFPFFALSWRGLKNKIETVYRFVEERDGQRAEFEWRVIANAAYGYPNPFDRRVSRAIDALIHEKLEEDGYPLVNPIGFSVYHIAKLMRLKFANNSRVYKDIKESVKRIVGATVESSGSFYMKDKRRWINNTFHIYAGVTFYGETRPNGAIADMNYLRLGEEYLRNINAQHVKPLDYRYLANLKSDLASRLYELLSSKFFGLPKNKNFLRISYLNLCQVLPIKPQKYFSDARRYLDPAHKELISTGFLSRVQWEHSKGKKDFNIVYHLGERAEKERRGELVKALAVEVEEVESPVPFVDKDSDEAIHLSDLANELHTRGLSKSIALRFSQKHSETYLLEKMAMFDFLDSTKSDIISKNPAGWLRRAIEDDWELTDEQRKTQEHRKKELAGEERRARWIAHCYNLVEEGLRNWDMTSPEERIKPIFNFWLSYTHNGDADSAEARAKKQEYLDRLPQTEDERRRHLERQHDPNPPDDFQ